MTETWTVGRVARWAADDFRSRGIENPRLEAELLLAQVLDVERMRIIVESERELEPAELSSYRDLIQRRRKGEPVAYIRGQKEFYGRIFRIDRRVLVPRPDTEILVETALRRTAHRSMGGRFLDLCTGSGCVAISMARERPTTRWDAVDLSSDAIAVARDNALRLGAVHQVRWLVGDLFAPLDASRDRYDLITVNPPYIPAGDLAGLQVDVRMFEPHLALLGGADGLSITRRVVERASDFLKAGGVLATEVGAGQADEVEKLMVAARFEMVERGKDYGGHERVVSGVWKG